MAARSKARKRALDVLYEAELRKVDPVALVAARLAAADPPVPEYAVELVQGVVAQRDRIDALLSRYAEGWTLDRMPAVDRNLLRLATYELLWLRADVPVAVVIDEAVELARSLSTDESPRFVNGLLAGIAEHEPVVAAHPEPPAYAGLDAGLDGAAGVGGEHAPGDQLLGERARGGVVDDGEGP